MLVTYSLKTKMQLYVLRYWLFYYIQSNIGINKIAQNCSLVAGGLALNTGCMGWKLAESNIQLI